MSSSSRVATRSSPNAYGLADVEAELPNRVDTRFLVASLTKPVVAFLALRLVDRGVVGLDDRAGEHVAALAGTAAGRATVHELLTHTAGLPHYEGWPGFLAQMGSPSSEDELIARLAHTELVGQAGVHRYSGPGYLLLGLVLEHATGEPLPALLDEQVLSPLGMRSSRLLDGDDVTLAHARPYVCDGERLVAAPHRHPSTLRSAGGLVTTARDLHRFARAVQRGDLLSEASHATLLRAVDHGYACGLIVYRHPWTRERFARHMGRMDGVAAHLVFGLDDERVCIALANVEPTAVAEIDDLVMAESSPMPQEEAAEGDR